MRALPGIAFGERLRSREGTKKTALQGTCGSRCMRLLCSFPRNRTVIVDINNCNSYNWYIYGVIMTTESSIQHVLSPQRTDEDLRRFAEEIDAVKRTAFARVGAEDV